ncbi:hypothetical protein O6H91_Y015600 [Diphasiastrum complanatum]|nr:hypothetical protein O6H91_Y015600 [Diphasiastrum complanatum]KAJ7298128.1 hypothetical protein O6H91_Y015600 [Diphasiastrum complanatum]KAJ7298129.1 hypothetical protein O6H91_Y015600 [Diphasiastrum complanatum]
MAQCYSESKHFPAAGNLKFYNGAFADDSVYRSSGGNEKLFEHFHERGVKSGHRRTYTEFGLPRDMNGENRPFDHVPQRFREGGLSREIDFKISSTECGSFKQKANISNESKLAATGTLRDFGDSDSNKLGCAPRSSLKREEMVSAEAKPMHRDQSSGYETIIPNSRSSLERSSKEQKTDSGSFDAELQNQRRPKGNTATSKIKTIPRPYGPTTAKETLPEDEHVSGRSTRSENSSGWASTGGFANTNFEREHKFENTFLAEGKSKVMEHRSSSSQGGTQVDPSDLRPPQNLRTRPRTRNLSEGNFSNIFKGEDLKNGLNERRLHVGSPTRSRGWNASAAGNVRPILHANRSSISEGGASGGGMYTGESSRWGTGTKLNEAAHNPPALLYDGYHDLNSRFISSEMSAAAVRAEIGFYEGVFGAGQAPYLGRTDNGKQSITSNQIGEASLNHARVDGAPSVSERLSFGSNTAESGNRISSKADRTHAGEASDVKFRGQNLNGGQFLEGRFDLKDGFANGRSSGSDHRPSIKGTLIVGNSSGRSDGRSSLDGNLGAARAIFKTENTNLEGDQSTNGRSYALNGFVHPKHENLPKKNGSVQHNRAKSTDAAYGNISNLVTGESFLFRKASFTSSKDDAEEVKRLGNEQYKKGRFAEALALYERAIFLAPGQASYHSNRAAALSALGRLVDAVQECKEAIRLDPLYARARRRLTSLFLRLGQIEDAKKTFYAAGEELDAGDMQQIQNIEKHHVRCFEARKVSDWKTVLRESDSAVLAGADSAPKVLALKAEALLNLHRPDEAAQVLSIAQRLEAALTTGGITLPDSTVLVVQAQFDMSQGRYQQALVAAEKAAHIQPKNIEVSNFLKKLIAILKARKIGNQLFKVGKYFEACAAYGEGLEADSTNAVLLCNRAACRFSIGLWEKSIEDCDAALEAQPTYVKARLRRAHSYAKLEKWEEALRDFEAVKRELPGNVEVARALFDAQVAFHKARGEEVSKTQFGAEVEKVSGIDQFSKAITSPGLAVVQFITRWSESCKQFLPFVDQLCQRYPAVNFLTVDIEEIPYLAKLENVADVPTLKIYRNGQKVQELNGPSHQDLEHALQFFTQ